MKDLNIILRFLGELGLDFEESQVYLALIEKKETTVLQVAKIKKISRTNVYRIIERLEKKGLVEEVKFKKKRFYKAVGTDKLEVLVKEQENKAEFLRSVMPELKNILPSSTTFSQLGTEVRFYKGVRGLQEMVENTLNSTTEILTYAMEETSDILGREFIGRWKVEFMLKKLNQRTVFNKENSRKFEYTLTEKGEQQYFQKRSVSSAIFEISKQIYIYSDVVAFFALYNGEYYGVEIYDKDFKRTQKQLFELVWENGRGM